MTLQNSSPGGPMRLQTGTRKAIRAFVARHRRCFPPAGIGHEAPRRGDPHEARPADSIPTSAPSGVRLALALAPPLAFVTPSVAHADNVVVVQGGAPQQHVHAELVRLQLRFRGLGRHLHAVGRRGSDELARGNRIPLHPRRRTVGRHGHSLRWGVRELCSNDVGNKALLALDGVFQGLGTLSIISSFIMPVRGARRW